MGGEIRMKIERLEYGDDPDTEYPEDFNSFKVYAVWSDPDIKIEDSDVPIEYKDLEEVDGNKEAKRLSVAVEFSMNQGGYFFIETPNPTTEWLNKVWELLQEKGWQGYGFNEIRNGCRGCIKVIRRKDYTALIDKEKKKVFHNRDMPRGAGAIDDLEDFWARPDKRLEAYILKVEDDNNKVRLSNGEKVWIEDRVDVSDDIVGENTELTVVVMPGSVTTDTFAGKEEITDDLGIDSLSDGKFPCKVVTEVTGYDVEDKWPEAKSNYGYPLVELDTGIGKVVTAHENVPPVEERQPYHEEGVKWKMVTRKLMLEDIDVI